jgi:single-stranded DNA-binding protein
MAVLSFSLAYSTKRNGEYTPAEWWTCKLFGKYAEAVHQSGKAPRKGDKAIVGGAARIHSYQGKDGTQKYSHEIIVEDLHVVPKKEQGATPTREFNSEDDVNF